VQFSEGELALGLLAYGFKHAGVGVESVTVDGQFALLLSHSQRLFRHACVGCVATHFFDILNIIII
jgi:hypothetical protein